MKLTTLCALMSCCAVVLSCGGGDTSPTQPPPPTPPVPTSIQLSATSVSLRIGETRQLTATVLDQQSRAMSGEAITWSSADTTTVVVDATGLTRGVRPGTATVTATSGTLTATVAGTVPAPTLQIETGASITATIGTAGDAINAQAANGTRFTLTVPPLALQSDTSITVTPITTVDDLPVGSTFIAALRMQPDGLTFLAPATLTMDLSVAPVTAGLSGIRFGDNGSALTLTPITATGTRLTVSIAHFSGAGAATLGCLPLALIAPTPRDVALNGLAYEQCKAQQTGSLDANAIVTILHTWYAASIQPGLASSASPLRARPLIGRRSWNGWTARDPRTQRCCAECSTAMRTRTRCSTEDSTRSLTSLSTRRARALRLRQGIGSETSRLSESSDAAAWGLSTRLTIIASDAWPP